MTDHDKKVFGDSLTALGVATGKEVDNALRAVYWQFLRDLEIAAFLRAVDAAGRTLKWFPKPSELRDLAGENLTAEVAEAWGVVRAAMDKHDYTTSVNFGPLVNAVVHNLGGWRQLCAKSVPELVWERKKFEEVYGAFRSKPVGELPASSFCAGAFGGAPVRIAIGGKLPPKMLEQRRGAVSDVVRRLADGASR